MTVTPEQETIEEMRGQLWVLRPTVPWTEWYDKCFGVVVRAKNELEARSLASNESGDEGSAAWLNPHLTTCDRLTNEGPSDVIMRDFHSA